MKDNYIIVIMDRNYNVLKRYLFKGTYAEANCKADELLETDDRYWGARVDLDI